MVSYPRTLGARTSIGRLALDPAWAGRLASVLAQSTLRDWLARSGFVDRNRRSLEVLGRGRDRFALVVTVSGGGRAARLSLAGRHQADATAAGAAELARALADGEIERPGVWLPEEVIDPGRFFDTLAASGWPVVSSDASGRAEGEGPLGAAVVTP